MSGLADRAARQVITTRLDRNIVVEAAAGTGKTTELVRRMVAVLAGGLGQVDGLVAVTFTEKAAGELKLRLRAGLDRARQEAGAGDARRRALERALARLEEVRIGTIHGFCADLLRERPVEARVDPRFRVLTEPEAERLYDEAFTRWLHENLERPPEGVRRALRRGARGDDDPAARLRRAGWTLMTWRDFQARWRRDPFDREAAVDALVERVHAFADLTARCAAPGKDALFLDTAPARRLSAEARRAEAVHPRDHDGLEAALAGLAADRDFRRARSGWGPLFAPDLPRPTVVEAHAALVAELESFQAAADADLAAALQPELLETGRRYASLKERSGTLDYADLLVRARDLIRGNDEVRADFQRRFTHLFVDEFQDTDPLQAELLLLLAAEDPAARDWRAARPRPGKLFVVGDPMQSIYRFRGADLGTWREATGLLVRSGADRVRLTTSFRATPSLQRMVNAAFAGAMDGDPVALQADYVPLAPHRDEAAGQPAVVALPVPRPYGVREVTKGAIDRSLPDAVAAFVDWLVRRSGWTVTERDRGSAERVPVAARHVCLLFRRFDSFWLGDVTRGYVRALEARGLPHLLVGGRSFHAREEVETMRAALSAIEWPDDELAVFATLRGSLFAIGDEELLRWRHELGRLHPHRAPRGEVPSALAPIAEALRLLASLNRSRNRRPVAETIALLLEATRAPAGFVLRTSGEQALANVLHVAELARACEASGGLSFRAFVERLLEEAETRQTAEAPILEEGSEGVRLMTVHKAKGLEFPVVVLADLTAKPVGPVSRFTDPGRGLCALRLAGWSPAELSEREEEEGRRDLAEGVRVAYVAATRARDLLVVPAVGDRRFEDGWVSCLNGALYPPAARLGGREPAPGCPPFTDDATIERPPDRAFEGGGVPPGRHRLPGDHDVVWWDAHELELDVEPRFGVRHRDLLAKETPPDVVAADVAAWRGWLAAREEALARGARPSLVPRTVRQETLDPRAPLPEVEVVELERDPARPRGARFGALVHAVLATAPLGTAGPGVDQVAGQLGRVLGATAAEVAAAARAAERARAHPLLARAAAAGADGRCRRETPVTLRVEDGAVVEGVIDVAFLEGGAWTVIDFKTDHELGEGGGLDVYRRQVALYARALEAATGQPARAVVLRV
jgi:ATP-dependent exoDNAse (exonuclease V) beta subunit